MYAYGLGVALRTVFAPVALTGRWLGGRQALLPTDVPRAPSSLGLTAKIALDEIFFMTEMVSAALISPRDGRRIGAEVSGALRMYRRHGWLEEPTTYHRDPPPLEALELRPARNGGVPFHHMIFDSGYAPHDGEPGAERWRQYTANQTAHAWVLQHPGTPGPWLLCLPGYRMGHPTVDFAGFWVRWLHYRLGLNIVIPVLPFHGPRTVGRRSGDGFLTGDFLDTVHMEAQAIWDIRRILTWVRTQEPTQVGVFGVSLGGLTAALLAALDADLQCVVAGIPAACLLRLTQAHAPAAVLRLARYVGLDWNEVGQLLRVISPLAVAPRVARERLHLFGGVADRLVPPDHVRDLWRHWERPQVLWYEGGHVSYLWDARIRTWLREVLHTAGMLQ